VRDERSGERLGVRGKSLSPLTSHPEPLTRFYQDIVMNQNKVRILVVDDDPFITKMLPLKLSSRGYSVETASDGAEALKKYVSGAENIKLIISDMNMPVMNGLDLMKEVRKLDADIPIIILTVNNEISVAVEAMNCGANGYVLKDGNILTTIFTSVEKGLEEYYLKKKNTQLMADLAQKNKELEKSNQELVKLNQLKNKFLGIAAHDLRNPLTSIRGLSELLVNETFGSLTPEQEEYIRIIHTASNDMLMLVNDLLDVSVIEGGNLELKIKKGSLTKMLEDRIKLSKVIAEKKGIVIHKDFPELPDIMFDSNRIAQAFDNFAGNAIKFSPLGANIYVTAKQEGDKIRVSVRDEGPGLSLEDQSRLFSEFQRLSPQPTDGERSTGLGLAIVKKIIEAHQGTLEVHSLLGSGSVFSFKIPMETRGPKK